MIRFTIKFVAIMILIMAWATYTRGEFAMGGELFLIMATGAWLIHKEVKNGQKE